MSTPNFLANFTINGTKTVESGTIKKETQLPFS